MSSPSTILGPQALDSTRRYTIGPLKGPDGERIVDAPWNVSLAGDEALACRLWRGEGGSAEATPAATWADAAAGTIALEITPEDLAGLAPGRYRIELLATIGGDPLACLPADAVIDLADAPGSLAVSGRLVTAEQVRSALGDPIASRPDLPDLIEAAGAWAEEYCRRSFAEATVTETLDGTGTPSLFLPRYPVTEIASVAVNGIELDNADGRAYSIHAASGELRRGDPGRPRELAPRWPAGFGNITITYTGGPSSVPATVRQAVIILVRHLVGQVDQDVGLKRLKIRDYEEERATAPTSVALPVAARALLSRHRRAVLR